MRLNKRLKLALMLVVVVLVMYPNPTVLWLTITRSLGPPVDPQAVHAIGTELPDNPEQIERLVITKYVPYAYDWSVYGVPWYFPTAAEVLRDRRGDCESRAILLASILDEKKIPYTLDVSPVHIWVTYRGKVENPYESQAVSFIEHKDGGRQLKLPEKLDLQQYVQVEIDALWNAMPGVRKTILFVGLGCVLVVDFLLSFALSLMRRRRVVPVAIEAEKS